MCYARLTYKSGGHGSQPLVRGFQTTVSDLYDLRVEPPGWRPPLGTQKAHGVRLLLVCMYIVQGADQMLCRRGGTRPSSALRLLRPGPSRPHAHSVRACGRPVGQRLPFDARAVCLPPVAAVAPVSAPSGDDACCSATALHGSGLSSGAAMAAATSAGVMRAHFGARYTWPRRCCAGCRTAVADHLLLETTGCAAVGRGIVMSSDSTEAWDTQEWAVIELQHHPCRPFGPHPLG